MMKFIKIWLFLIVFCCFAVSPIFAQLQGNPANFCRNGFFPRESDNYSIAKIKGNKGERIYFYGDEREDCPQAKNCRLKSYLIPNDEVIVSRKFGNYACAWFQPKKGSETVGWLSLENLEFQNLLQSFDEIVGNWSFYDNDIKIVKTTKSGIYNVTGNAFWKGLGDNIHIGELDGEAKIIGDDLKYGEEDNNEFACKATFRLISNYLIVSDNLNCGGANVTFSGVYRRKNGR